MEREPRTERAMAMVGVYAPSSLPTVSIQSRSKDAATLLRNSRRMSARGRILDRVPAILSLRLRAHPNVRRLFGLHGMADLIISLVPRGKIAVDVGANRGIYTYWMSKRASAVEAFEPQPWLVGYLRGAHLRNVHVHEVALSEHEGTARLLVPADEAQARLASSGNLAVPTPAQPGGGVGQILDVATAPLDSFNLHDIGFLKIDVEGHELAVMAGADETIRRSRPVVFAESEARHAAGAPGRLIELLLGRYGYRRAAFVRRYELVDIGEFDLQRDQLRLLPDYMNEAYVCNFVFWP